MGKTIGDFFFVPCDPQLFSLACEKLLRVFLCVQLKKLHHISEKEFYQISKYHLTLNIPFGIISIWLSTDWERLAKLKRKESNDESSVF